MASFNAQILQYHWYLGPKALLFGSLDLQGVGWKARAKSHLSGIRGSKLLLYMGTRSIHISGDPARQAEQVKAVKALP